MNNKFVNQNKNINMRSARKIELAEIMDRVEGLSPKS